MASFVAENLINYDGIEVEVSKFNSPHLISLLEESNGEEYNDELLNRVIQSLEAEINEPNIVECHDPVVEDGRNCLASRGFGWKDIDNMELIAPSSPSEDLNWSNNYMESDLVEFENNVSDYPEIYKVVPSVDEHSFNSLWVETYDTAVYH